MSIQPIKRYSLVFLLFASLCLPGIAQSDNNASANGLSEESKPLSGTEESQEPGQYTAPALSDQNAAPAPTGQNTPASADSGSAVAAAQRKLDIGRALSEENIDAVERILTSAPEEESAALEDAVLESARKAIFSGKLELAAQLSELVLLHNIDNVRAQDLYTSVEDAKRQKAALEERRREEERIATQKAAEEKARLEAEEKARLEAEKAEQERLAAIEEVRRFKEEEEKRKAEEEAFLKEVRQVSIKNFSLLFDIAPLALNLGSSEFADIYTGTKTLNSRYGFGAQIQGRFTHPYVYSKLIGSVVVNPVIISGIDERLLLNTRLSFGFPQLLGPFAIGAGFYQSNYTNKDSTEGQSVLYTSLGSPTLGIGIEDLLLFRLLYTSLRFDWLVISAIDPLITSAFKVELQLRYHFKDIKDGTGWYIANDCRFASFGVSPNSEWSFDMTVSAGVLLYAKNKK